MFVVVAVAKSVAVVVAEVAAVVFGQMRPPVAAGDFPVAESTFV